MVNLTKDFFRRVKSHSPVDQTPVELSANHLSRQRAIITKVSDLVNTHSPMYIKLITALV
jgi:hypothetical protein